MGNLFIMSVGSVLAGQIDRSLSSWGSEARRALVAVSASSNRSKSDADPAEWMPRQRAHCRYVRECVAVKTRWQLSVDRTEKQALLSTAGGCRNVVILVRTATVVLR